MGTYGILSCGAYVPRKRMSRAAIFDAIGWAQPSLKGLAKGVRSFGAWDENAITMAVEAARSTLHHSSPLPDTVCFASTTAPFLDRQNAGVVAAALDLSENTHAFDTSGSQRAATSALICLIANKGVNSLLTTADCRKTKPASPLEMQYGDAGASVLIGDGKPIAEIIGVNSVYSDFVDHYRTAESQTDYVLEERWYREEGLTKVAPSAILLLLERHGVKASDIDHVVAPLPNPALGRSVVKSIGANSNVLAESLFEHCGYAGAAHPLLLLARTLEQAKPGEWILLTAFGQGCDAILLRATDAITEAPGRGNVQQQLEDSIIEETYTRFLAAAGALDIERGMRGERDNRTAQSVAYNKSRDIYGFVGGVCSTCDTPQFPKSRRCVNPDCGALDTQSDYRFADRRATIKSFTEDWMAFTREPPLIYGNVSFEGGGNVFMEMAGFQPGDAAIGSPVEMMFRIKDIDEARGFHRYFWKAAPIRGGANG